MMLLTVWSVIFFKADFIIKHKFIPILQLHVIQGHFTDSVTLLHLQNNSLISELCSYKMFPLQLKTHEKIYIFSF